MRSFNEIVQKRGYQFIDEGLTAGVAVDPNASAMRNFIIQAAKEEDPASLPAKYEATKAWIESGTEEMRRELYKILYAFYFHSIIIMVKAKTDSVLVNKFVKNHMNDHHKYHKQDYGKIQEITKGQITQQYEETKFSLKITHTCFNALVAYLSHSSFANFLRILDEKLSIEFVSLEKVQYSPDLISEFILPAGSTGESSKKLTVSLRKSNPIDLANEYIRDFEKKTKDAQDQTQVADNHSGLQKTLEILDDNPEERSTTDFLPDVHIEQVLTTVTNFINMARLGKNILPSCAYFTFPHHDTYYDINDDGTLISVCTNTGITKLISTDAHVDIDDLPPYSQITARNERGLQFDFVNQLEVPRLQVKFQEGQQIEKTYFTRSLIGPRALFSKFSPSSQFLLTGGAGYVRLWPCEHVGCFSHVPTPASINWCGEWSPCGHQFVIGSEDNTASLWSVDRATMVRLFVGHQKPVNCCKYHPNCELVATCSSDCSIHLWDIVDGTSKRTFADRTEPPTCMEFTRNGRILITGDEAGALTAWDLRGDNKLGRVQAHNGPVRDITISMEGNLIATVGSDSEILLWDAETFKTSAIGQAKPLKKLLPKDVDTRRAKFSSRNLLLALGSSIDPNY